MAWTNPLTWVVGQLVTAAQLNIHIRDNLLYLKGGAGAIALDSQIRPGRQVNAAATGAVAIDWNTGSRYEALLTGNVTFTFTNPVAGTTYGIRLLQDATGGRTVTWPTIKWKGGVAPVLSALNKADIISLYYDGTSYYGDYTLNL